MNKYLSEAEGPGCYEPQHPLLVPVARVLHQRDALARLCGEMLTTLQIPANQQPLTELGIKYGEILARWKQRYEKESGQ